MRKIRRTGLALVGMLVVLVGAALWQAGRAGSSAVESWVAGQINVVAEAYLEPKLSFVDLDYEFPSTVRLKSLRLTAEDAANPGKTLDIIACDEAEVELTEIPAPGRPIQIASIVLKKPLFQAVAVGDGSRRLIGFSELLKRDPVQQTTQPAGAQQQPSQAKQPVAQAAPLIEQAAPAAEVGTTVHVPRLSEFLRMTRVELIDGQIISDARIAGVPRMQIDKINTRLDLEPGADGWYTLDTRITREPVFDLAIAGRLNLDTFTAADAVITLKAQVAREHDGYLPPELQNFLREHEIQGALEATITGTLPLLEPGRGTMQIHATLSKANVSYRDYRVPVDSLVLSAALDGGVLKLSKLHISALRGEAEMRGSMVMNASLDADLRVIVRDMILDETIRDGTAAAREPKYGGRVNARFEASAPMRSLATTQPRADTWGRGTIAVDHGRLVQIPVVQGLGRAITRGTSWLTRRSGAGGKGTGTDRANVTFTLSGHEAHCSEMTYVGEVFAARGRGSVAFNHELDLILNAGPLEKMQNLLGKRLGGMFAKLTDAIAGYHVTGTVAEPDVGVQIAGGRVNKVGRSMKNGIGRVVDEVSDLTGAGE